MKGIISKHVDHLLLLLNGVFRTICCPKFKKKLSEGYKSDAWRYCWVLLFEVLEAISGLLNYGYYTTCNFVPILWGRLGGCLFVLLLHHCLKFGLSDVRSIRGVMLTFREFSYHRQPYISLRILELNWSDRASCGHDNTSLQLNEIE